MGDWIVGLDDLPTFQDGFPLSAESLNRIGAVENYLNERWARTIPGQMIMQLETPASEGPDTTSRSMFFVHLHRYLHWSFTQETAVSGRSFRMRINGKRAVEIDGSSPTSNGGVIDLNGTDLDGNSYGLTVGRAYEVQWATLAGSLSGVYGRVYASNTYECATDDDSIDLPSTNPSFSGGGTPTAADLAAIVDNCNFLLQENGLTHSPGYTYQKVHIPAPGGFAEHISRVAHHQQYLTVRFDVEMGYYANVITSTVKVNGTTYYTDTQSKEGLGGDVVHQYKLHLDVSGLTVGSVYTVEIITDKEEWDDLTNMVVYYIGESPSNTLPSW